MTFKYWKKEKKEFQANKDYLKIGQRDKQNNNNETKKTPKTGLGSLFS